MNQCKISNNIECFISKEVTVILFVTSNTHCIFNEPIIVINGEEGTKECQEIEFLSAGCLLKYNVTANT